MEGPTSRQPGRRRRREPLWLDAVDAPDDAREREPAPRPRPRRRPDPPPRRRRPPDPQPEPRRRRRTGLSGATAPARRTSVSRAWQLQIASLAIGLILAGLLLLLVVAGDAQFWLNVGGALVAFGLAFDLYARAVGAIAAREASETAWAVACALGGSPVVAGHALTRRSGPAAPELDTLAGLLALTLVLALLVASLSGSVQGA